LRRQLTEAGGRPVCVTHALRRQTLSLSLSSLGNKTHHHEKHLHAFVDCVNWWLEWLHDIQFSPRRQRTSRQSHVDCRGAPLAESRFQATTCILRIVATDSSG